jgi:hypothetical protein
MMNAARAGLPVVATVSRVSRNRDLPQRFN